ncbi:MAG: SoxR reducing system RseC family protein [Bacillota bacterium]
MREIGTVVSVGERRITVSVKKTDACASCRQCSHAHVAFGDNDTLVIEALPVGEVKPGDKVELEMTNKDYLRLSFLIYIVPVLALLGGLGLGWLLGSLLEKASLWSAVFGIGSLGLSFLWLHNYDKAARQTGRYLPIARPYSTSFDRLSPD